MYKIEKELAEANFSLADAKKEIGLLQLKLSERNDTTPTAKFSHAQLKSTIVKRLPSSQLEDFAKGTYKDLLSLR